MDYCECAGNGGPGGEFDEKERSGIVQLLPDTPLENLSRPTIRAQLPLPRQVEIKPHDDLSGPIVRSIGRSGRVHGNGAQREHQCGRAYAAPPEPAEFA